MNEVNVRQARGAGTVLALVFLWPVLIWWWALLLCCWIVWLLIAGVATILSPGLFSETWYQPWPIWLWGIR
jgi:hypothetical protein